MSFLSVIKKFIILPTDKNIDLQVRKHFRRNFITNTMDGAFWMFGESFVSVNTILPVFASTLTDSAIVIGMVPALIQAGWFLPQLFMAGYVNHLEKKLPFAKKMALVERAPYLILPLTAFLLPKLSENTAIWLFMIVVAWRGIASGMIALPWQELIAMVIPIPVRSRFFGVSRTIGRSMAVVGSVIAGIILAYFAYPINYAISFMVGAVFVWVSYFFFVRNIEPQVSNESVSKAPIYTRRMDLKSFKRILKKDKNFRYYLISRSLFQLASMAIAFLAVYSIQTFRLADEQAAVFSGLLFTSAIAGFFVWGVFGDKVGPKKLLLFSDILQIILLGWILIAGNIWSIYGVFLVFGFSQSGNIIGELVLAMELGKEDERPIYMGLARSIPGVFILIAPLIGGTIVNLSGYPLMFITSFLLTLIGFLVLLRVDQRPDLIVGNSQ